MRMGGLWDVQGLPREMMGRENTLRAPRVHPGTQKQVGSCAVLIPAEHRWTLGIAVQCSPHSRPNASSCNTSLLSALNFPLGLSRWSSPLGWPSLAVTFTCQQHHMSPTCWPNWTVPRLPASAPLLSSAQCLCPRCSPPQTMPALSHTLSSTAPLPPASLFPVGL